MIGAQSYYPIVRWHKFWNGHSALFSVLKVRMDLSMSLNCLTCAACNVTLLAVISLACDRLRGNGAAMCVALHVFLHPLCICDVISQVTFWGSADAGLVMGRPFSVIGRVGDGCHVHGVFTFFRTLCMVAM